MMLKWVNRIQYETKIILIVSGAPFESLPLRDEQLGREIAGSLFPS